MRSRRCVRRVRQAPAHSDGRTRPPPHTLAPSSCNGRTTVPASAGIPGDRPAASARGDYPGDYCVCSQAAAAWWPWRERWSAYIEFDEPVVSRPTGTDHVALIGSEVQFIDLVVLRARRADGEQREESGGATHSRGRRRSRAGAQGWRLHRRRRCVCEVEVRRLYAPLPNLPNARRDVA